ncbi:hypothetical protein [Hyphomicrobium sp.]|uniref:hypothetical protein n=1 Tax=Hyphomicrobium sp. TaxID=82 RepID=UPI000F914264|nr:hypothetical protein [Hyphomicrobium sp.]RUO98571.1 MAG: hypothetical protein EKK30_10100 [Hyphomicrobium sp.]
MTLATTRREFSNVIAGQTVDGRPSELPVLSFSKSENAIHLAACAADLMLRILSSARCKLPPPERTQLLWKFAAYVSKAGLRLQNPSLATRAVHAAHFLADRPQLITSRMGMGKIVELSLQRARSRANEAARTEERVPGPQPSETMSVVPSTFEPEDAPPRPIVWLSHDRMYRLEELVHRAHLVEEGIHMHHCLSWKTNEYWRTIRSGRRRIYSLRREQDFLATFTHIDRSLTELTHRCPRDDAAVNALADAYRHIDRIYGPLSLNLRDGGHLLLTRALEHGRERTQDPYM